MKLYAVGTSNDWPKRFRYIQWIEQNFPKQLKNLLETIIQRLNNDTKYKHGSVVRPTFLPGCGR